VSALEQYEIQPIGRHVERSLRLVEWSPGPTFTSGRPVAERRAVRRARQRRRRAIVAVGLLATCVAVIVAPNHAFGGTNASGLPSDVASAARLQPGAVYVVEPGDTLSSIARSIDPLNPTKAERLLIAELGSTTIVSGEHVLIP
jgi:hypothetical protein